MALQKCKECANEVSSEATLCPKCGAPIKKQKKKTSGCLLVLIAAVAFVFYVNTKQDHKTESSVNAKEPEVSEIKITDPNDKALSAALENQPAQPKSKINWMTGSVRDEMTDEERPYITTESLNRVEFKFPYQMIGGSKVNIVIRKDKGEKVAYLTIDKGHMICSYDDCNIKVKGESGSVQSWRASKASTGVTNALFIENVGAFEKFIRKNKRIRIGIEFYQYGIRSFDFDTSGYPGV